MPSPEPTGLLVICGVWDERGGLQQQLRSLVDDVTGSGGRVTVLTWGRRPGRAVKEEATVVRLPTPWRWSNELPGWRGRLNVAAALCTGVPAALALRRRWAVAFAAGLNPEALVGTLAARLGRRRAVARTWLVGPWGNVARLQRSVVAPLVLRLLRRTAVIAETEEAVEELKGAGVAPATILLVPYGVDLDRWAVPSAAEREAARRRLGVDGAAGVVVWCGRYDLKQKRLDVLLAAWEAADVPGWRLVLAGDGPDSEAVRRLAGPIEPAVVLVPWQDDPRWVLAAADAFAQPTDAETTGQALLEGLAMGLPGIVSATSSLLSRAPDGVALVPNDAGAWAAALTALAADDTERIRRGVQARTWVERNHNLRRQLPELRSVLGV
jgi:hypothetical protein